jgi:ribosomal-protein-serine acetyltransferase
MSDDHTFVLADDVLRLRAFRRDDAEELHIAVRDSLSELGKWLSWCHPDYSLADSIQFLKGRKKAFQVDGEYGFAVTEQAGGRLVGACGINQIEKAALRANLGYWLRTSATGQGHATRATVMVAQWAFRELKLERIEIVAATGNEKSQRVALRAGAVREGTARRRLRVHGVQHDAEVFSLVNDDFR